MPSTSNKPPSGPPPPAPEGESEAQRIARDLAKALGQDAAEAEAAARGVPASEGGEGRLQLDRSGALLGLGKLKPVLAHARPEGEAPPAAPAASTAAAAAAPKKAALPPRIGAFVPAGFPDAAGGEAVDVDEVEVPGGVFLYGEDLQSRLVPSFRIDKTPVTHAAYERFVKETGHRAPLYWPAGHLPDDLRPHPVVGVDYFDALAYARWLEKDLPHEDEWERAARGTDGRPLPWGSDADQTWANTARTGLRMTVPVGLHPQNVSPDGMLDAVGNVWQITHSPAPGGGVVVRGGSWFDFAFHAKTWFRFAARPTTRNGTIGFRCVRRSGPRPEAPSEVDPAVVEAEIAARRGPQPPADTAAFAAERRDLVPELRRLRMFLAERSGEQALAEASRTPVRAAGVPGAPPTTPAGATAAASSTAAAIEAAAAAARVAAGRAAAERAAAERAVAEQGVAERAASERALAERAASERALAERAAADRALAERAAAERAAADRALAERAAAARAAAERVAAERAAVQRSAAERVAAERVAAERVAAERAAAERAAAERLAAERAARPVAPPEPAGPLHVEAPSLKTPTPPGLLTKLAAPEPVVAAPPEPTLERLSQQTPRAMWALLAVGFALLLALLLWLLSQEKEGPPAGGDPDVGTGGTVDPVAAGQDDEFFQGLPAPPFGQAPLDGQPARLVDGATGTWLEALRQGPWVLIFSGGPDAQAAAVTRASAHVLHRRLDGRGVRVALVVPRRMLQGPDGMLPGPDELKRALTALDARDGLTVLLDPDAMGLEAIREARYGLPSPCAAVLLVDGKIAAQSSPPSGGMDLRRLLPVAKRAFEYVAR